jgi:hypothetical protein
MFKNIDLLNKKIIYEMTEGTDGIEVGGGEVLNLDDLLHNKPLEEFYGYTYSVLKTIQTHRIMNTFNNKYNTNFFIEYCNIVKDLKQDIIEYPKGISLGAGGIIFEL